MGVIEKDQYTDWMQQLAAESTRKRLPKFIGLDALPPLRNADGDQLPDELVKKLIIHVLASDRLARDEVTEALAGWVAPASADGFAWAVFNLWAGQKFKKAHQDVLQVLAQVGRAETATKLAEQIATWAKGKANEKNRAIAAVDALAAIDDDEALRQLIKLSRLPSLSNKADSALEAIAEDRGVDQATLRDQVMPWREELLALDTPKKLPNIIKPKELPPLYAKEAPDQPLERAFVEGVIRAFIDPNTARAFRSPLRSFLEPDSAEALALHLFEAWKKKDFNGRYRWILDAIGALGRDRMALELEPYLIKWPKESDTGRKRTMQALDVFRQMGTDTALLVLVGLGIKPVKPSVYEQARAVLSQAARDRGLSLEELGDRISPHCDLDARGSRVFDYGPRQFKLIFDDELTPRLRDSKNTLLDSLPKQRNEDDPEKVAAATEAWELMSGQLQEIMKVQTQRLEQHLITNRRWKLEDWKAFILEHPLMINYARRLLWGVFDDEDELQLAFRAAEDDTLVDIEDEELELPSSGRLGLVHPLHLAPELRSRWIGHFRDYEIVTPFAQIGRPTSAVEPSEHDQKEITRFSDTTFSAKSIHDGMIRFIWMREPGYVRTYFSKRFGRDGVEVRIHISPGITAGSSDYAEDQVIPRVTFRAYGTKLRQVADGNGLLKLQDVPAVVFSEAIYTILRLDGVSLD